MTKEIKVIEKKVSVLVEQAQELVIVDNETLSQGVVLLSEMNKIVDRVTEEKEKVTKPLNEALKAERARWKPVENMYEEATVSLRAKMSTYQTELVRKQKEEEQKIAARIGEGKGKIKLDTAVRKMGEIEVAEKEVATDSGLVQFREVATLKITNEALIPREYLIINEKKLLEALKSGKTIEGCEIEIIQTPVNYR